MKHKSDVFDKFQEFHAIIQNKFDRSIKILRIDNGKEYINNNMLRYLAKHRIQLKTTAPHTPKQNERSERDNRILVESARSMQKTSCSAMGGSNEYYSIYLKSNADSSH